MQSIDLWLVSQSLDEEREISEANKKCGTHSDLGSAARRPPIPPSLGWSVSFLSFFRQLVDYQPKPESEPRS